jgi:flagellar protein FliS
MSSYQQHTLESASPVELVVALYDGIIRFLFQAIAAVEAGDVSGRRAAVKRALDIVIHLQARLRMDIGGRPAEVLSEFYASMFALTLQASQTASADRFREAIQCVRNVRDAWRQVAQQVPQSSAPTDVRTVHLHKATAPSADSETVRWTA